MAHEQLPQMLSKIDLLAGVPVRVIEDLIEAGSIFTIRPGGTVVEQGSTSAGLQVILEGTANVEVGGASRAPMGPGNYFGEISVIDGAGRSATITAGDDGLKTFTISPLNFMQLVDRHPPLARALLKELCARVRSLERPNDLH
jgi:CRP/FNR family cyclic AMP-dependent transcriptional regulator